MTGAASGIGTRVAQALVAERMQVVLADVDKDKLAAETDLLGRRDAQAHAVITDVRDPDAVEALATVATLSRPPLRQFVTS